MTDLSEIIAFYIFTTLILGFALMVVFARDVVHSAIFLLLSMLSVAGFYVLLNAEFLAAVQIFIYAGAVTVMILFVIMLTATRILPQKAWKEGFSLSALVIAGSLLAAIGFILFRTLWVYEFTAPLKNTGDLGILLFRNYILPFEVAGIILLVALVGAIVLARKEEE